MCSPQPEVTNADKPRLESEGVLGPSFRAGWAASMSVPGFYRYWGKARPADDSAAAHHLLPYHCLDVAAAGRVFLNRASGLRRWLASAVGASEEAVVDWICFWLALHDLGKFSEAFESQCPEAVLALRGRQPRLANYGVRHDTLGMVFWRQSLFDRVVEGEWFGPETEDYQDGLHAWMGAVTGHHGQPPDLGAPIAWTHHFNRAEDSPAINEFCAAIRPMFLTPEAGRVPTALSPVDSVRWSVGTSTTTRCQPTLRAWRRSDTM